VVYGVTSGISAYTLLRGQLAWMASQGMRVLLVSNPDDEAITAAEREGVEFRGIAMTRRISPLADLRALSGWLRLLSSARPQAVNASTPKAALLGHLASCLVGVPRRIYVVRGLRVEGASGIAGALLWLTERLTMALATDVVFVSVSLAAQAHRRRLIKPGRGWLVGAGSSNGVDAAAVSKRVISVDKARLRAELGIAPDAFVLGFVGRITGDKGVDTIVRAMRSPALNSATRFLVIGVIEDDALAVAIRALGDTVRVIPWTDDVWGHLPAMDVLCLPTRREGFPNVVLEAAAAGIPAIVTNATGAVDSVIDGETGYIIDIGDDRALVERLNELASAPDRLRELGTAARARVERDFAPERIWQGVHSITEGRGVTADVTRV
jgi:glycosyltransferase involved in cell wall biosynthesis